MRRVLRHRAEEVTEPDHADVVHASRAWLAAPPRMRPTPPRPAPNILLIYADDQSYKTVGCYPESWPWVKTPNIDALATVRRPVPRRVPRRRGACRRGRRCSPAIIRTPSSRCGWRASTPGSTYDPKQCPFWPALFRTSGYHTAPDRQVAHGRRRRVRPRLGLPDRLEPAQAPRQRRRRITSSRCSPSTARRRWQDGYPADNYTKWAVEYVKGAQPRQGQAVVPVAVLRERSRPVEAGGAAQGTVQGRQGARRRRTSSARGPASPTTSRTRWHGRRTRTGGSSRPPAARRSATTPRRRQGGRVRGLGAAGERVRAGRRRGRRRAA